LSALGAFTREIEPAPRRFAGLFLGPQIGGGLIVDGELADLATLGENKRFHCGGTSVFATMPREEFRHARIRDLRKAVRKGNVAVTEFARAIARQTGEISVALMHQFEPDIILLGGGLMDEMKEEILDIVAGEIQRGVASALPPTFELVGSVIGDLAGMLGAAALAARHRATVAC
jgi:predicted NBD/HSP70 family sugar kinase